MCGACSIAKVNGKHWSTATEMAQASKGSFPIPGVAKDERTGESFFKVEILVHCSLIRVQHMV